MNDPKLRALWQQRPDSAGTAPDPAYGAVPPAAVLLASTPRARRGGCEGDRHYYVKQGGQWVCTMCGATR